MKIVLGTAQIGMRYGLKNNFKKLKKKESYKILNSLKKLGVEYIDTARVYGDAEHIIGNSKVKNTKIITKIPKLDLRKNINEQISNNFFKSLKILKKKKIYAVLLHDSDQLLSVKGHEIFKSLKNLKSASYVSKIGLSLYEPNHLNKIIRKYFVPDIIQIPYSLLDTRFDRFNLLQKLKKLNIEIHARSIFLQGLLLIEQKNLNHYFVKYKKIFNWISKQAYKRNLSVKEMAYCYVLQNKFIDKMVIGVDNFLDLKELVKIEKKLTNNKIIIKRKKFDDNLIIPKNWKLIK